MSTRLVIGFATEGALRVALERLRAARLGEFTTYTPTALDGAAVSSPLPLLILIAGLAGAAIAFGTEVYANTVGYPLDIGGRPGFSWPSFVPIAFEAGALSAVLTGVVGFFAASGMPRYHEPVDASSAVREASRDAWTVVLEADTPDHAARVRALVVDLEPVVVDEVDA